MNQKKRELEQNELAGALEEKLDALKPHAFLITVVTLSIIAAVILTAWLVYSKSQIAGSRWQQLFIADNTGDARLLEQVASDNESTLAGSLGLLKAADYEARDAFFSSFENRTEMKAKLRTAKENYSKAYNSAATTYPLFKRRALFGLAYTSEALGDIEEAREHYQTLVDTAKDTPIYQQASLGLQRTSNPIYSGLNAAFAEWKPPSFAPIGTERPDIEFMLEEDAPGMPDDGLSRPNREDELDG